jgi:hypothetical protein
VCDGPGDGRNRNREDQQRQNLAEAGIHKLFALGSKTRRHVARYQIITVKRPSGVVLNRGTSLTP